MSSEDQKIVTIPLFLKKLWKMVNDKCAEDIVGWNSTGDRFIIYDQVKFITELLPQYFKHNNLSSFIRQLNFYGFHKISSVIKNEMEFAHPYFLKDLPETLAFITRKSPNLKPKVSSSIKEDEVKGLLDGVKELKNKHILVENELQLLKRENAALWTEINSLRIKYFKQTKIINKLIHFLISYIHSHQNPFSKQNITVTRKCDSRNLKSSPKLLEIDYLNKNFDKVMESDPVAKRNTSGAITYQPSDESIPNLFSEIPREADNFHITNEYPIEEVITEMDPFLIGSSTYTVKFPKSNQEFLPLEAEQSIYPNIMQPNISNPNSNLSKIQLAINTPSPMDVGNYYSNISKKKIEKNSPEKLISILPEQRPTITNNSHVVPSSGNGTSKKHIETSLSSSKNNCSKNFPNLQYQIEIPLKEMSKSENTPKFSQPSIAQTPETPHREQINENKVGMLDADLLLKCATNTDPLEKSSDFLPNVQNETMPSISLQKSSIGSKKRTDMKTSMAKSFPLLEIGPNIHQTSNLKYSSEILPDIKSVSMPSKPLFQNSQTTKKRRARKSSVEMGPTKSKISKTSHIKSNGKPEIISEAKLTLGNSKDKSFKTLSKLQHRLGKPSLKKMLEIQAKTKTANKPAPLEPLSLVDTEQSRSKMPNNSQIMLSVGELEGDSNQLTLTNSNNLCSKTPSELQHTSDIPLEEILPELQCINIPSDSFLENLPEEILPDISTTIDNTENALPSKDLVTYNILENPKENFGLYLDNTQLELNNLQTILNSLNSNEIADLARYFEAADDSDKNNLSLITEELETELSGLPTNVSSAETTVANQVATVNHSNAESIYSEDFVNQYFNADFK